MQIEMNYEDDIYILIVKSEEDQNEEDFMDVKPYLEDLQLEYLGENTSVKEEILSSEGSVADEENRELFTEKDGRVQMCYDPNSEINECALCSRKVKLLRQHLYRKHKGVKFQLIPNVSKPRKPRGPIEPEECQVCPICNTSVKLLKQHIRRQHTRKGRQYASQRSLKQEMYTCRQCNMVYKSRNSFIGHINSHDGHTPFKCDLCPRAYTSSAVLRKHRILHLGINYICDHCKKSFRAKDLLICHLKSHSESKFVCNLCGRVYKLMSSLRKHLKYDHVENPGQQCTMCSKKYFRFYLLRKHMLKEHNYNLISRKIYLNMLPMLNSCQRQLMET